MASEASGAGGAQPARGLFRPLVRGEERLDAELLQRDVVWRAEAGERGEVAQPQAVTRELDGQERRRGDVEVETAPLARHVGIRQELVQQPPGLVVPTAADGVAMEPLDERGRRRLPVA